MRARVSFFALVATLAIVASGCWRVADLDGPGVPGGNGRTLNSLDSPSPETAMLANGVGILAYQDTSTHRLRVGIDAAAIGGGWTFRDVDGPGVGQSTDEVAGASVIAAGEDGLDINLYYLNSTQRRLRQAVSVDGGTTWSITDLDGPGVTGGGGRTSDPVGASARAVMFDGEVHVFYIRFHSTSSAVPFGLRHAWYDGTWHFEDLDGYGSPPGGGRTTDNVGRYPSVAVAGGVLHHFSGSDPASKLRHIAFDGTAWTFEYLDGPGVPGAGRTTDPVAWGNAAVEFNGQIHNIYQALPAGSPSPVRVRHTWFDGTTWQFEDVDGPGVAGGGGRTSDRVSIGIFGSRSAAAVPFGNGELHVAYTRFGANQTLRDAWFDGVMWRFAEVDGAASTSPGRITTNVGISTALLFYAGQLHVFHSDLVNHRLRWGCSTSSAGAAPAACI